MKTTRKFWTALLTAALILSGCSEKTTDNSETEASISETSPAQSTEAETTVSAENTPTETEWSEITLEFPSGNDEITEYNKDILSVDRFTADLSLPSGWDVRSESPSGTKYLNAGVFSVRYIYNENDNCIGSLGYNVIPDLSEEESKIPAAVYNQIALGNGYQFNVRNRYDIVQSSDTSETALTDVYYSDSFNDGNGEKTNKGIVIQDTSAGVYIAAEFESDALTDEQHTKIAESLKITMSEAASEDTDSPRSAEIVPVSESETEASLSENDTPVLESGIDIDLDKALELINANSKIVGNDTCGYIRVYAGSEYEEKEDGGYTVTSDLTRTSVFLIDNIGTDINMTAYMFCLTAAMNAETDGFETYDVNDFSVDGMDGYIAAMADKDTDLGFMMYAAVVDTDIKAIRCINCTVSEYTPENIVSASWIFDTYSRKLADN
ncbi:MAG: hypothetical protein J1E40_04660 [Oscillospiraceae bacterium]|nr:hypothetical protein [Oscillospiraceae bacterium]